MHTTVSDGVRQPAVDLEPLRPNDERAQIRSLLSDADSRNAHADPPLTGALSTLIVGFGRAGRDLHLAALRAARTSSGMTSVFAPTPIHVVDPAYRSTDVPADVVFARSIEELSPIWSSTDAVVHLCTQPVDRLDLIRLFAELGYRRFVLEKPPVDNVLDLDQLLRLRAKFDLQVLVVGNWLSSTVTDEIKRIADQGELGPLLSIKITQRKSRITRTLASTARISAFDIEIPHSVGVAIHLAGRVKTLVSASSTDMVVNERSFPSAGGASITIAHESGIVTEIVSDLSSPVRERQLVAGFSRGRVVANYPVSADDDYGHVQLTHGGSAPQSETKTWLIRDDSMRRFMIEAYTSLAESAPIRSGPKSLEFNADVIRLIGDAKVAASQREATSADDRTAGSSFVVG